MEELADALVRLGADLGARRFTATSSDGIAQATVDGHSGIVEVVVQDQALRGAHRHMIGPAIVTAITAAREGATAHTQSQLGDIFDQTETDRHDPEPPPDDEYTGQFSVFEPKETRGRW